MGVDELGGLESLSGCPNPSLSSENPGIAETFKVKISRSEIVIAAAGLLCLALLLHRLFLGVDLSDEGFYLANAKCIIDWGRPFVMSLTLSQTSIMLTVPLVQFWQSLLHFGSNGTILWLRFSYLVLSGVTGFVFFSYANTRIKRPLALLLSFLPVVWIPYGLPALSYNTLGENFFFIGLCLCCLQNRALFRPLQSALVSIPFALACLAYPSLPLACVIFLGATAVVSADRGEKKNALVTLVVLILLGVVSAVLLVLLCGQSNILHALDFYKQYAHVDQGHKLEALQLQVSGYFFPLFATIALSAGITVVSNVSARIKDMALLIVAATLVWASCLPTNMFLQSHAELDLLALFILPLLFRGQQMRSVTKMALVGSWLAGLIVSFSSTNGVMALCVGAFPAICLGLCEIVRRQEEQQNQFSRAAALVLVSAVIFVNLRSSLSVYGTDRLASQSSLTETMPSGPFKGLKTQTEKGQTILSLSHDLELLVGDPKTIYFIGPPGYYTCTDLKPLDPTFYHFDGHVFEGIKPLVAQFYEDHGRPDVMVATNDQYFGKLNSMDQDWIDHYYSVLKRDPRYTIYVRR